MWIQKISVYMKSKSNGDKRVDLTLNSLYIIHVRLDSYSPGGEADGTITCKKTEPTKSGKPMAIWVNKERNN